MLRRGAKDYTDEMKLALILKQCLMEFWFVRVLALRIRSGSLEGGCSSRASLMARGEEK
jgi:hypothetical protein